MKIWLCAALLVLGIATAQATVLNRGNGGEPASLDPQFVGGTFEINIVGDLMVGLTTLDAAAHPVPGMADSWKISSDGTMWTFHLRKALWSDGTPVTAGDFLFAFRRLLDPHTAARNAGDLWVLKNAAAISAGKMPMTALGVAAPRPDTLILHLEHPVSYLPELLAGPAASPLPRHVVEVQGAAWARPGAYVSNGPYTLKEWLPNDHIGLAKNPRFYDAAGVRIDTVNYLPTPDSAAALSRYRAGELDMQTPVPAQELPWLRARLNGELHVTPALALSYLAINLGDPALKDVRVRRALNLAIDREALVQKVFKLGETPAYGLVPPGIADYPLPPEMDFRKLPYPARLAEAQRLMQAAGYGPFNRLRLTYAASSTPDNKRLAAVFQAMCRTIYIDLDIRLSDAPTQLANLHQHHFQLAGAGWYADVNDAGNFLDLLRSNGANNYAHYTNPRFDAALDAAQAEPDPRRRGALLKTAEVIALADYPWVPWRVPSQTDLVKPRVKGWVDNAADYHRSRWLWLQK